MKYNKFVQAQHFFCPSACCILLRSGKLHVSYILEICDFIEKTDDEKVVVEGRTRACTRGREGNRRLKLPEGDGYTG